MTVTDYLKDQYERDASRFRDLSSGPTERDIVIYPLLEGLQGALLEYGCGAGSLLLHLARGGRFQRPYGVDISEKALSRVQSAWQRYKPTVQDKLRLYQPSADRLPLISDNSINVIISVTRLYE